MNTYLTMLRGRIRRVARLAGQAANVLDLLNLDFLAHLARLVLTVAILLLVLLTLVARLAADLAVATFRVLRVVVFRAAGALMNHLPLLLVTTSLYKASIMESLDPFNLG